MSPPVRSFSIGPSDSSENYLPAEQNQFNLIQESLARRMMSPVHFIFNLCDIDDEFDTMGVHVESGEEDEV